MQKSTFSKRKSRPRNYKKQKQITYNKNYIFWCNRCNLPLIGKECGICNNIGNKINLSQPGDVRFCSSYEREILSQKLQSIYGCNPIEDKLILLNKIPGEDKTDEVIVDGYHIGTLRFDLETLDYKFDISLVGSKILLNHTDKKTVTVKDTKRHLSGKKVKFDQIEYYTDDIKNGEQVLIKTPKLTGYGTAYLDSKDFSASEKAVLKVKKIDNSEVTLSEKNPDLNDVIIANASHLKQLQKNAMNTIKGIVNQKEYKNLPVHVSFSGGKDSLVVLDLTRKALKNRELKAFFINTGIEYPETVEFARRFTSENNIDFVESGAGNKFWEKVGDFGPPAKDFRWCCKVCKLAPANTIIDKCSEKGMCLTVDGKRTYESFSRSAISTIEQNPFVPNQLNIFPIKDWKAIELWLYIYWQKLEYNPLYDMGFERVGCYLCPAALSAEYQRMKEIHPEMYEHWNNFLLNWAHRNGLPDEFVEHGFWRWRQLPPKMLKLAEKLDIRTTPEKPEEPFSVEMTSGISPCKSGGYTVEGTVKGMYIDQAAGIMNIMGKTVFSQDLGTLLVKTDTASIKVFSSGNIQVTAKTKDESHSVFKETTRQLKRAVKCKKCGICKDICPVGAVKLSDGTENHTNITIDESCTKCGKCTQSCVILKYPDNL
ncbi:phosphoadenosine phosphosulfate reductase [Methanohalobium evestigatum Z-7303]|uniref:Phosphoadenosine phosphosulfate reductase n=1 Tax=Methanohalobium evestigatum (strain ATCC BAA-1072 / DSM 3721 / NBRC 107634 / OCM 161 / Z-7303) TaxID=644295 RepID=D7E975_METEZ|nr:phosphoadenosine phosphosulfate reductase family protein [Methanohalobium evestigatum]ADI74023.1 phosphoadenosine phosphosulfate reductase [Methanohalobium evestigatum Z-7303]